MRKVTGFLALALALAMLLGVAGCAGQTPAAAPTPMEPEATASEAEGLYTPGTYTATAQGNNGDVTISVTFSANAIDDIVIDAHAETPGLGETALETLRAAVLEKQTLGVDTITGATVSSNAFLTALEDCVKQAGGDVNALQAGTDDALPAAEDVSADIVVVGGGVSGLTAAINARYLNKNVILVEKMSMLGGNSILSTTGVSAAESAVQKAQNVTYTKDDFYNSMKPDGPGMIAEAVRVLADESGAAVDWINSLGIGFEKLANGSSHGPLDGSGPGVHLIPTLSAEAEKTGVDVRLDTKAVEIVMADGKATGIKVESPAGNYTITAKAVILCAGGFANNPEMVAQYDPRWEGLGCSSSVGQTGDGILMAQAAGADLHSIENIRVNPTVLYVDSKMLSMSMLRHNGGIMVNKEGKRFANERGGYTEASAAVVAQTDKCAYMIFDTTMLDLAIVKEYYDQGLFESAPTLEELAAKLGIDAAGLVETVETYKTYVANELDPEFGKTNFSVDFTKPDFIGVKVSPAAQGTFGGVKVDADTRVIDVNGNAIPGLYAAGENAGEGTEGAAPLTECMVFGKVAAETATAEIG